MSNRFYCGDHPLASGQRVDLPAEESRHLLKTMRGRIGDQLVVFGGGHQFAGELVAAEQGIATVLVSEAITGPAEPRVQMTFLVPWIKGGKTDYLVQKLTELGASSIVVFHARREVARGDGSKVERLTRIALEACKQCERVTVPEIFTAGSLKSGFEITHSTAENRIVLHERSGSCTLSNFFTDRVTPPASLAIASGPEGGWHPDELEELQGSATFVTMGSRIFRAETAPLVAAAALLTLSGEI